MVSKVAICNMAITLVDGETITSVSSGSDASKESLLCSIHYDHVRQSVLAEHPWNFATVQADLQLDAAAPAFEYGYSYTLPADCLRVVRSETDDIPWKVKGRSVHSDSSGMAVEYIKDEEDTTIYPPYFVDCLVLKLASRLAFPLGRGVTKEQGLVEEYKTMLKGAKLTDGREGHHDPLNPTAVLSSWHGADPLPAESTTYVGY